MKNHKFFFGVVAVLFVLGVFALFFFGFKSRVFANVRMVNVSPQVAVAVVAKGVTREVQVARVVDAVPTQEVAVVNVSVIKDVKIVGVQRHVPGIIDLAKHVIVPVEVTNKIVEV